MNLQDEFTNGVDRLNKMAYSLIHGNAKNGPKKPKEKELYHLAMKLKLVI